MPVYQTNEIYLREAIESILGQSYSHFELIIVNDSPDDESRLYEIVDSYHDKRIVWISNHVNGGIATASNLGIESASGLFIAMMDHDDICLPTRFETQVKFLLENPQLGFIGGQAEAFYPDQTIVKLNYAISSSTDALKQSFFDGVPFLNPSVMFRKSVLAQRRYNPNYQVCADYDLFARLVFIDEIAANNLPDVLIRYRFHDTNTSLKKCLLAEEETIEIQQWIAQYNNS